jgi:hypothetical protein
VYLLGLEEQDGTVAEVKVDEVFRLCTLVSFRWPEHFSRTHQRTMSNEASKVATHDAVPCGTLPAVELQRG